MSQDNIDIKDKIVSNQTHGMNDITCGGSLENPKHKLSKKIEKSIFNALSLTTPTEEERDFIYRDENNNVMVVDKTNGVSVDVWKEVTGATSLADGDYLIVCDESSVVFDGSLTSLDVVSNLVNVEIVDSEEYGKYILDSDDINNKYFTIGDNLTSLKSQSGYYIGQTTNGNGLKTSDTTPYVNTIEYAEGTININIISSGAYLRYNPSSGQTRFRYFKSSSYSSQKAIQLYKRGVIQGNDEYTWKTLVSNDDIDIITDEELDEMLVPKCNSGNLKEECCDPETNNIIPCE